MARLGGALLIIALLAGSPATSSPAAEVLGDEIRVYGDVETPESLGSAQERFIREMTAAFGSREAASEALARTAWQLYGDDDLAAAMRRFDEAWLLNPQSPQPYWGFGAILHDQGKVHEALAMLRRASELDPSNPRVMADFARVIAQEGTSMPTAAEREQYFTKAGELFEKATGLDPNNGHSYGRWALALYDHGRYAESWAKVHKAQELQEVIPEKFLRLLRERMPEPKRP